MKRRQAQKFVGLLGAGSCVLPWTSSPLVSHAASQSTMDSLKTELTVHSVTSEMAEMSMSTTIPLESSQVATTTSASTEGSRSQETTTTTDSAQSASTQSEQSKETTSTTTKPTTTSSSSVGPLPPTSSKQATASSETTTTSTAKQETSSTSMASGTEDTQTYTYLPNQTTQQFIDRIGKTAQKVAQTHQLYASVMLAQAILESASGNSRLATAPNYNLFGIKGTYRGQGTTMKTFEDDGEGKMYTIQAQFRKYPGYEQSLEDYAYLLKTDFYKGAWKSQTTDYHAATRFLTGRYATDTAYFRKLDGLIESYQLTKYDGDSAVDQSDTNPIESFIEQIALPLQKKGEAQQVYPSYLIAEAILQTGGGQLSAYQTAGQWVQQFSENQIVRKESSYAAKEEQQLAYYQTKLTLGADFQKQRDVLIQELSQASGLHQKDTRYAQKIAQLIHQYDLTKYDQKLTGVVQETATARNFRILEEQEKRQEQAEQLSVSAQDSLYPVAQSERTTFESKGATKRTIGKIEQPATETLRSKSFKGYYFIRASTKRTPVMHQVAAGETLQQIAKIYRVSVRQLVQWNPKLTVLTEGQQIRISSPFTSQSEAEKHIIYI